MKPKASQLERRSKSVGSKGAAFGPQILNCNHINALPAAARGHEQFYLLLFRNVIKQLALMLVFGTSAVSLVHGVESTVPVADQGFIWECPGNFSTRPGEIVVRPASYSWTRCSELISAFPVPGFSQEFPPHRAGSTPEGHQPATQRAAPACEVLSKRQRGAGLDLWFSNNPGTTFTDYV
jgi:hypothetical protein